MNPKPETIGPAIVVLSPSLPVIHMNRRARALLNQLTHTAQNIGAEQAVAVTRWRNGIGKGSARVLAFDRAEWELFFFLYTSGFQSGCTQDTCH
ncbi:MAG TPA: hypothetical protein VK901_21995, partial [Nitrospiraceae bacterium]|nr:hypothetical protein [Nitrospiraceae bacterium]